MKPLHGDVGSNESCSCTSCVSDTDQSLQRLLAQGSKIERLFNGKYIPLRESKLLDKLIRTRALYDSVRKELLSSSVSVSSKANLKPRKSPIEKGALEEAKKSSDILTLVDLVDKGLGSKKLNECCSCCNCNSKTRLHDHAQKGRRYRQAHAGGNITSRSSVMSRHGTGEELRSGNKMQAKNIKSDPCTCACEGELQSRVMLKKIRPEQPKPIIERKPLTTTTDKYKFMMLNNERLRKSYHKLRRSKANPTQYIENMGEGGIKTKKIKQPRGFLEAQKMKSKEQIKQVRRKIKEHFETDRKTVQKSKPLEDLPVEGIVADNLSNIKKGSALKLKDKISNKRQPIGKDWELKQSIARRSKNSHAAKLLKNISAISSASNASLVKEQNAKPVKSVSKKLKMLSQQINITDTSAEPHTDVDIAKNLTVPSAASNQKQKMRPQKINKKDISAESHIDLEIAKNLVEDPAGSNQKQKMLPLKTNKKDTPAEPHNYVEIGKYLAAAPAGSNQKQKMRPLKTNKKDLAELHVDLEIAKNVVKPPAGSNQKQKMRPPKINKKDTSAEAHNDVEIGKYLAESPEGSNQKQKMRPLKTNKKDISPEAHFDAEVAKNFIESPAGWNQKQKTLPQKINKKINTSDEPHIDEKIPNTLIELSARLNQKQKGRKSDSPLARLGKKRSTKSMTNLPSLLSTDKVHKDKQVPLIKTKAKDPTFKRIGKLLKSISTSSIEKSTPVGTEDLNTRKPDRKTPSAHFVKAFDQNQLITKPLIPNDKMVKLPDAPFRYEPRKPKLPDAPFRYEPRKPKLPEAPFRYEPEKPRLVKKSLQEEPQKVEESRLPEKSPKIKQKDVMKNIQARSHALKRCLCSLKIKVKRTKSKVNKSHASDCECPNISTKQKRGTKYHSTQTETKSSGHAMKCDYVCLDTKLNVKEKQPSKSFKPDQTNTRRVTKSTSIHASDCECPDMNEKTHLETKSTSNHPSECECTNLTIIPGKKRGTKLYLSTQTDTPEKIKSSSHASKCECLTTNAITEEKLGTEYHAQTDTQHASLCECPIINIITKEKWGLGFPLGYKSTHPEIKSNKKISKCECSTFNVITKEKEILPTKQRKQDEVPPHSVKSISETSKPRFSIELFKTTHAKDNFENIRDIRTKKRQNNMKHVNKSGIRTKRILSQISNSTGKSKYTKTKHGLRRCLCTLKLGKFEKKRNSPRTRSKIPAASPESMNPNTQRAVINVSKLTSKNSHIKQTILPYECECKKVLIKREDKKLRKRIKISNKHQESRSNSSKNSLTSRSMQLPKAKKLHSILVTHNSEVPIQILKKKGIKDLTTSSRHQARPSFTLKFLKERRAPSFDLHMNTGSKIKKDVKTSPLGENLDYIKNIKQEKKHLLGPTIKRCLCNLKLQKRHKIKICAVENINLDVERITKGPKGKYSSLLRPYECEPYICVPGECDKYECLERIMKRNNVRSSKHLGILTRNNVRSKELGIVTHKNKMVSKSSDTRKLESISKVLFVNSDFKQQKSAIQQLKKMRNYSDLSYQPRNGRELYSANSLRKGFRIGSHFSFNIEFSKDLPPVRNLTTKSNNIKRKRFNNKRKPQSIDINARHKTKRVSPILKRCFCTLKLLKNDKQKLGSKFKTPFIMKKPTQVYAVSTVTVAKTKLNSPKKKLNNVNIGSHSVDSYDLCSYKNTLSRIKRWQYFKKESASSIFSISTISFKSKNMHSYFRESKHKLLQISPTNQSLLDITSKEMVRFESKFSCQVNYLKSFESKQRDFLKSTHSQSYALRQRKWKYLKSQEEVNGPKIKQITDPSKLTGVQPLLRRCYCTMNIQVASPTPKKRHHQHNPSRLKDYECEPGVCIPYECDPYQCQKLIMKRLMRKVSRMSGSDRRLKSSSSLTSTMSSGSRTRKLQSSLLRENKHHVAKSRPTGLKYQTLPRSPRTQKQAVRVGSVFSFDIEFSKSRSNPTPVTEMVKVPTRSSRTRSSKTSDRYRRSRGTRGLGVDTRDRESQSMISQMRHRASSVTPMLKRCFCTLKLQKKGRQQKELELQVINQGTSTPTNYQVEKPIVRRTETGQNTKSRKHELLPYECEPNICIPGECDPYECLELIKRRNRKHTKEFGTNSMASKITSRSSMTARQRQKRKHMQSRNIRVKSIKSRDTSVKSKPSAISIDKQTIPSRQAVRLSSSFSFNVEFYKDKTSTPHDADRNPPETYVDKIPKDVRKIPKHVHVHEQMRESFSQDLKSTRDTDSQVGVLKHGQSTMTSAFLKRCFCTAKLHGIKVDGTKTKQHFGESFSALKRCFCTLKSFNASKKEQYKTTSTTTGNEKVASLAPRQVVKKDNPTILEPYECEPGVCVPGSCNPYECEKLIRKRRIKEKMAGTTAAKTKSTSSSFASSKTSKAGMTQATLQGKHHEKVKKQSIREILIKEKPTTPVLPQKQAVRIGSNFSFNIEFYKDLKLPELQVQPATTTAYRKTRRTRDQGNGATYRPRTTDRGLHRRSTGQQSRESQMYAAKKEDKSLGPMLKRCFCTLKLHKQKQSINNHVEKEKSMHQGTSTPVIKQVPTLQTRSVMTTNKQKAYPYKLEPYECEPGVCVPGECDPYECEKRIKKRLMSRASSTGRHRTRSTSNTIKPRYKYRDSVAQSSMKRTRPSKQSKVRRSELRSEVVARPSRQAVKIGSNFSFDIEFFKDRSPGYSIPSTKAIKQYATYEKPRRTESRSTDRRSVCSRNKRAQRSKTVRDMDSQVLAQKMRSTMTGVGPFLKRCFCTLQLHHSQKDKIPYDGISVATRTEKVRVQPSIASKITEKTTHTQKIAQHHSRKLEPYECEPGVCVPGECDPYECEKRIKRRMQSRQSNTEQHKGRSVSSSIAESTKSRPRRTQAKSYTPSGRKIRTIRGEDEFRVKESVTYDTSPNRQAVRVGSSFSFNVEFYKDKTPQLPGNIPKMKYIKHDIKETETRPKTTRSMSSYGRRAHLRDCQSQSDCVKTDCKASCAPLLKRCFCTLKLQKIGTQHQQTKVKIEPSLKSQGTRTSMKKKVEIQPVAREMGTITKKRAHILEPYECEPGVCIPGQCDPYECEKRIRLRNMKHFGTGTTYASMKSISSLTSRDKGSKAMNTLMLKDIGDHKRKTSTETIYRKQPRPSHVRENVNRQSLNLGSNFSFNIEFYKDHTSDHGGPDRNEITDRYDQRKSYYKPPAVKPSQYRSKTNISTAYRTKSKSQGSNGRDRLLNHRKSQASAKTESRASGMGPLLKRCFCTLMLQRAEVKSTINAPASQKKVTSTKSTGTKKKYIPPPTPVVQQLDPFECEPNVCIPGECNPYECLERIKRRGIRRLSRTTGTRMKRNSQVSASTMASQLMPGYRAKRTQFEEESYAPQNVDRIVEEPRFPFLHGNANTRQAVKISSNFSFNIEFFKEVSPQETTVSRKPICPQKEICRAKDICTKCNKSGYTTLSTKIGQHDTRKNDLRSHESQSERVKTEDKSSAVAMLRRCFCTAKLHKTHLARTQNTKRSLSPGPKTLTVGRVEEIRPLSFFGPKEYWVQYQIQQPICKHCKGIKNTGETRATTKNNRKSDPNKLETIMSYTPSKYNKIKSKTHQKNNETNSGKTCCSTCQCNRKLCQMQSQSGKKSNFFNNLNKTCCSICQCKRKFCKMPSTADVKTTKSTTRLANTSTLKKMLCQCKVLFGKHRNRRDDENVETENKKSSEPGGVLKLSKSERHPNRTAKARLKKSKSLKIAKLSAKDVHQNKKKYSRFQSGDAGCQGYVNKKSQKSGINFVKKICPHCQTEFKQPTPANKQVHFSMSPTKKEKQRQKILNTVATYKRKKSKSISYLYNSSKYNNTEDLKHLRLCDRCGGFKTKRKLPTTEQDMYLETNKQILQYNKDEDKTIVPQVSRKKHKLSCPCCVCRKNKTQVNTTRTAIPSGYEASAGPIASASPSTSASPSAIPSASPSAKKVKKKPKSKPCVCGSPACKKAVEKREENWESEIRKSKRKVCVCGTDICNRETAREARLAEFGFKRTQKKKKTARKIAHEAKEREKMYKKEDDELMRKRKLKDKYMMKMLKKYKNTSDVMLVAESALDISKLGLTSAAEILHNVFRAVFDPKRTYRHIRTYIRDPMRAWKKFNDAANDGAGVATLKRLKMRASAMSCVKSGVEKLEEYPASNFVIHAKDRDPKRRFNPRRPRRPHRDTDFGCSPLLLSLRKKPWLSVYYNCAWFYPHCLSLLQVWTQFTDIILFLLAVAVWSPCIITMELCRAMMCCCLCTG